MCRRNMTILLTVLLLTGWTNSWADAPLSDLLRENPTAARDMTELRLIWADKIAIAQRGEVNARAAADSISDDLWECLITRPAERGRFDTFEAGVALGSAVVVLLVWAMRNILE